jgi:hypothetical protein
MQTLGVERGRKGAKVPRRQGIEDWEAQLTLTVIAKAHLGLAEANGVLASTDAIVLL